MKILKEFGNIFQLDLRSLAAMRILLGLCTLYDFSYRLTDLIGHYTDKGALPTKLSSMIVPNDFMALGISEHAGTFSLYYFSGELWWSLTLLLISILVATLYTIGWRVRWINILLFILVLSVQNRNILQFYPGDYLLRSLLLLSIFLPIGCFFSVDSKRYNLEAEKNYVSQIYPGFAFVFFMFAFFVMAGLSKTGSSWSDGSAVHYIMIRKRFSTGLGDWMIAYPLLMEILTHASLWFERLGPLLLLVPVQNWLFRTMGIIGLGGLLLGFGIFLNIHILPFIGIAGLAALIPSEVWELLRKKQASWKFDINSKTFVEKARWHRVFSYSLLTIFILLFSLTEYNRSTRFYPDKEAIQIPDPIVKVSRLFRIANPWRMFPDTKKLSDGWLIVEGITQSGRVVDILTSKDVTESMPSNFTEAYGGFRWRRYLRMILLTKWGRSQEILLKNLGSYHCRNWNEKNKEDKVTEIKYILMKIESYPPGGSPSPPVREEVSQLACKV